MGDMNRRRALTDGARFRQYEDGDIEAVNSGNFSVRIDGREYPYANLGSTWLDADNVAGETGRVAFAASHPLLPFFFSRGSRPGATQVFNSFIPRFFSDWICDQANFGRSQSRTDAVFDYQNMLAGSGFRAGRQFEEKLWRDAGNTLQTRQPGHATFLVSWDLDGSDAQAALGLSDGSFADAYDDENGEPDPGNTREHSVVFANVESLAVVDELVYVEILYDIETVDTIDPGGEDEEEEYSNTEKTILFALNATPTQDEFGLWEITKAWHVDLGGLSGDQVRHTNSDIVIADGRAAILYEGTGDGATLFHVDALDGSDTQEVDLSSVWMENGLSLLSPRVDSAKAKATFVTDDGFLIIGGFGIGLTKIDLSSNSIIWTNGEGTIYHPLGFADQSLVCAWEETIFETITDREYPLVAWDEGLVDSVRLPELGRGHSHKAGICGINLASGGETGRTLLPGEEPNGTIADPIIDYRVESFSYDYARTANPDDAGPPGGGRDWNMWDDGCTSQGLSFPSFRDYFTGALPVESYQETNSSGTHIEGPLVGSYFGDYNGIAGPVLPTSGSCFCSFSWQCDNEWFRNGIKNGLHQRPSGPPQISTFEEYAETTEKDFRKTNGDWIRAEVIRMTTTVALFDGFSHSVPADMTGSVELSQTKFLESVRESTGTPPVSYSLNTIGIGSGSPTLGTTYGGLIPHPTPPVGTYREEWSDEYKDLFDAWDGTGIAPYEGDATYNYDGPDFSGGDDVQYKIRTVWRPAVTVFDRTKTPPPNYQLAPSCSSGRYVIFGPHTAADDLEWAAYGASGNLVWSLSIADPGAFAYDSIILSVPGDARAVFTFYVASGGARSLVIIDSDRGVTLYDDAPSFLTSTLFDPVFTDGKIISGTNQITDQ